MGYWSFWAVAGALALVVVAVLTQSLRRPVTEQDPDSAPDLQIYRDQLTEVDRDAARGLLTPEEAARLRTEVSRRLLDADRAAAAPKARHAALPPLAAMAVVFATLTGAVWLYARIGAPGYDDLALTDRLALTEEAYKTRPSQQEAETAAAAMPLDAERPAPDPADLELMEKLRAVIKDRPDDIDGLMLLARNEAALGNFAAATAVQAHLVDLMGAKASADQHAALAQYRIAAAGGYVSPEAESALIAALERDPRQPLARYFSGLMWAQVGRPDRAFALWKPLLEEGPPDAPWIAPIRAGITDLAELAGIRYALPDAKGPTAADMQAAGEMTDADRQTMIEGMVAQLETRLTEQGGGLEDWTKLLNALKVLNQPDRLQAALTHAEAALPDQTEALRAAAGVAP